MIYGPTGPYNHLLEAKEVDCPHCNESGISAWSKFMAGTAVPAKCKICGKPSSVSGGILGTMGAVFHFIFIGAAIASFYYWNWWPLIISLVVYVLLELCVIKWIPLKALSEEQVASSKKSFYIFIAVFILLIIFAGLTDG